MYISVHVFIFVHRSILYRRICTCVVNNRVLDSKKIFQKTPHCQNGCLIAVKETIHIFSFFVRLLILGRTAVEWKSLFHFCRKFVWLLHMSHIDQGSKLFLWKLVLVYLIQKFISFYPIKYLSESKTFSPNIQF